MLFRSKTNENFYYYYINLKDDGSNAQDKIETLINLLHGIENKHSQTTEKKSVKLIIDDINTLDNREYQT